MKMWHVYAFIAAFIGMPLVIAFAIKGCGRNQQAYAEGQAKEYAQSLGIKNATVLCVDSDTDGDGYVSCTLSVPRPDGGKPDLQAIECSTSSSWNDGCRVPQVKGVPQ